MKKWTNYVIIILFFFILIYSLWNKFIKEKLPRELPFNLTLFGLLFLIILFLILLLTIIKLLLPPKKSKLYMTFNNTILRVLDMLKEYFFQIEYLNNIYINFIMKTTKTFLKYHYVLHFLNIIPRIILVFAFVIDIWNNELYYIYNIAYIYIFIYVKSLIITHLKILEVNRSDYIQKNLEIRINHFTKIITIEELIILQTNHLDTYHTFFHYGLLPNDNLIKDLNISSQGHKINMKKVLEGARSIIQLIIEVHLTLYLYNKLHEKDKNLLLIIKIIYLTGWLYIIYISLFTLTITKEEFHILNILHNNVEPFSGILINKEF